MNGDTTVDLYRARGEDSVTTVDIRKVYVSAYARPDWYRPKRRRPWLVRPLTGRQVPFDSLMTDTTCEVTA